MLHHLLEQQAKEGKGALQHSQTSENIILDLTEKIKFIITVDVIFFVDF